MTELTQGALDYIGSNPTLGVTAAFLIAMGEALLIIGLFVPSTATLIAIGGLVGLGKLPFWPVFIATFLGAVAGDAISFWVGYIYRDRLKEIWPFSRYRGLFEAGQAYFAKHGGKSVVIGRFIPGVKAVVPGIAGMMDMGVVRFQVLNVLSAVVWAAAHSCPASPPALLCNGLARSAAAWPSSSSFSFSSWSRWCGLLAPLCGSASPICRTALLLPSITLVCAKPVSAFSWSG